MYQRLMVLLLGACFLAETYAVTFSFDKISRQLIREITECNKTGFQCDDCGFSVECIEAQDQVFIVNRNPCDAGSSCSDITGQCTSQPNAKCDANMKFAMKCTQVGLFPNPFNRCEYTLCQLDSMGVIDPIGKVKTCSAGYAFDPYTSLCRVKLQVGEGCTPLIQPCFNSSTRGIIPGHPSMYYICLRDANNVLLPQLYLCPRDQVYNTTLRACQDIVHNKGVDANNKCLTKGYYYVPNNCQQYYECGGTGYVPALRNCPDKKRFDEKLSWCIDFTCSQLDPFKL